ncbi:floral homeotic protein DEFICIENS-like [Andrographis paniculata]|uniref:floral homeotic protein DEFICIENS-like n=1 Tax=Andrographis paniculata TaxID=175694 RepID=UPI0021E987C2|nr:floral homeotic protein DEFICIENS-like [Andrographis paniculata]
MARGKIQIKRIENQTNRQVTYSKRRNGLFKKAHELSVLCDAKVSIIMISTTHKLHEYITPTVTTKQVIDQYQKVVGVDLWNTHYEKMQEHLKKLKEVNRNLRMEIRQRMGESLTDMGYEQIVNLIEDIDTSLRLIRERKYKVISNQIETGRKKLRNVEEIHKNLMLEFDAKEDDQHYRLVGNNGNYDSVLGYPNGGPCIVALRPPPPNHYNHHHHHNHNNHHSNFLHQCGGASASDLITFPLLE